MTAQQLWTQTNQDLEIILQALKTASSNLRDRSDSMTTAINGNVQSFFAEMHSFLQEVQDLGRTNHAETTTEVPLIAIHHSFFSWPSVT